MDHGRAASRQAVEWTKLDMIEARAFRSAAVALNRPQHLWRAKRCLLAIRFFGGDTRWRT